MNALRNLQKVGNVCIIYCRLFGRNVKSTFLILLTSSLTIAAFCGSALRDPVYAVTPKSASELSRAPHLQVTPISPAGFFSEPSVAVNSRNPSQVTVVYQYASAAYSGDAGAHWAHSSRIGIKSYRVSGDVSVVYDNSGHAIMCCIAFDRLGTTDYWAHGATRNGIFVKRSLDGGKNWQGGYDVVDSQGTKPGIPFEDKPYIVADNTHGRFAGNLYVGWTEWRLTESVILFSRSTDDGVTWSTPQDISTVHGLPRDDNGSVEGFDGVVTPDGVLHVVWSNGNHIVYKTSSDGGKTFTPDREILTTAPSAFVPANVYRANGFPQIACNSAGKLYITWSDYRNGDIDVFESYSTDGGTNWSSPVRVNNDPVHDGKDQFMQWLAVDQSSGAVNVIFYDRRLDPRNIRTWVVLGRSTDGGLSFANYLMSDTSFVPTRTFIGDYTGLAASGGRVYGAWTEHVTDKNKEHHATVVKVGVADFNEIK